MTLDLPPAATVFSLSGLGGKSLTGWLSGLFDHDPYHRIPLNYPANLSPHSLAAGAAAFDDAVRHCNDVIIGLGHSQGVQALLRWMERNRANVSVPGPSQLIFVFTGNPLRNNTGKGIGVKEVDGLIGRPAPTDFPWRVIDVARRYDSWAIQRKWWDKPWLQTHTNYRPVDLFDPDNEIVERGNTTFVTTA